MQLTGIGRIAARVTTAGVLAGSVLSLSATWAQAAALGNHKISGIEDAISCLTSSRCVAVGTGNGSNGAVVTLTNGRQTHVSTLASAPLTAVSCPSDAGCWAIGPRLEDAGLLLVKIGPTGRVTKSIKATASTAQLLSRISCVSMKSCELAGNDVLVNPSVPEIASWTGKKLSLHKLAPLPESTTNTLQGISCWRTSCAAVGYYSFGAAQFAGFAVIVKRGKPGKPHTIMDDELYGVSCVSASKCYAAGHSTVAEGVLVTITNGVPGKVHSESADMFGMECAGSACRSSGEEPGSSGDVGVIVTLHNGVPRGTPLVDKAVDGFSGPCTIARRGSGYAAVGQSAVGSGSEVTTG